MRIFVAIDIPNDLRVRIQELLGKLKPTAPSIRWSRIEGLHITLKFLGEVPQPKIEAVTRQLATITFPSDLLISIKGVGYFPSDLSPRIVWLGINSAPDLGALASNIDAAMSAIGFEKEARPYSPHLTLARTGGTKIIALQDALQRMQPLSLGSFKAKEFFLYESKPRQGGSEYVKISRFGNMSGVSEEMSREH